MNKMTIEEKAKAYDEALERARKVHRNYKNLFPEYSYSDDIEDIFPVLRESEDERIRKYIAKIMEDLLWLGDEPFTKEQVIDWLEKHKEEEIKKIRSEEYTKGFNDAAFGGKIKEWSEEDVDEAAEKYADENTEEEYYTDEGIIQTYSIAYEAFKAGAEWMTEQIRKKEKEADE